MAGTCSIRFVNSILSPMIYCAFFNRERKASEINYMSVCALHEET